MESMEGLLIEVNEGSPAEAEEMELVEGPKLMIVQNKYGNQEVQGSPRFVQSLTHFFRQEGLAERVICFYLL